MASDERVECNGAEGNLVPAVKVLIRPEIEVDCVHARKEMSTLGGMPRGIIRCLAGATEEQKRTGEGLPICLYSDRVTTGS